MKATVQAIAQSVGIEHLDENLAEALAGDVTYRIRQVVQDALKFQLHSCRKALMPTDIDAALALRGLSPLYGYTSASKFDFKNPPGRPDLFYFDDREV